MASSRLRIVILACLVPLLFGATALAASPASEILAGNRAAEKGDLERAIKHFTAAIDSGKLSKENMAIAHNNRGSAWDDRRQPDKAIKDYSKAIELNPNYDAAYYNRSYAYERKGQIALAFRDMENAVRLEPDDQDFQQRLLYLKTRMGSEH